MGDLNITMEEYIKLQAEKLEGVERRLIGKLLYTSYSQGLHSIEEMVEDKFEAYWVGSTRVILDKGDLGDYWTAISSDRDFLGDAPTYTYIKDPHGAGDGECPVPIGIVFFRHAEWRKSGARLSGDTLLGILLLTLAWDHIRGPYANVNTTYDPYLDGGNGRACNDSDIQEKEE
ncbi:hypothetical protein Tco_0494243 [Tanacetum coccineum]